MNANKLIYILLIILCSSCMKDAKKEKHFNYQKNIINVREQIKEIEIEDVFISAASPLYVFEEYLIIVDLRATKKMLHVFDKNNFDYITSIVDNGPGPAEVTSMGHVQYDKINRKFLVSDHGKQRIFSFDLDSAFADPHYIPIVKTRIKNSRFPDYYHYVNDTLSICRIVELDPIGNNGGYQYSIGKWNMITGEITPMKYTRPGIKTKRVTLSVSMEHGIYAEFYSNCDLITICNLDGELVCNIYGRKWNSNTNTNRILYHYRGLLCNDKIVVAYSGENNFSAERRATKFIVLDINGNYLKTLETDYKIVEFCFDKDNNRIIMALDSEIQFAYLDLDGIIE